MRATLKGENVMKAWLIMFSILRRIEVKSTDGFHSPMEYMKCETLS